jgi:hypothetical protein
MAEALEQNPSGAYTETDLLAAVRQVLERSDEPLTLSKLRSGLPAALRGVSLEALEEALQRQVGANVLHQYPKYRSPQNRYWDRPMNVHLAFLLRATLAEKPLALSELRRKLPDYAKLQAEAVLEEEVGRGNLFRHPALSSRSGPRFGARRADPRDYLRDELQAVFRRLERLGFTAADLREGALDLLHEEEWGPSEGREAGAAGAESGQESQPSAASQLRPEGSGREGSDVGRGPADERQPQAAASQAGQPS